MSIKFYNIYVYCFGKWIEIQSDKFLFGDLVLVLCIKEDSGVVCDMILVEGIVIVNEVMFFGESIFFFKDLI